MLNRLGFTALGAAAALVLAACGSSTSDASGSSCQAEARNVVIATGNPTGVYAAMGQGLSDLLSANTPLKASTVTTSSTLRNVQQLATGEYDVAFAQADGAADAVRGQGVFAEPQKGQALARIYSDYVHVVVSASSGITAMDGFRGKKISTGSGASGTELIADRLLTAAGLDPKKDVSAQSLDLGATVAAIKSGSIDGFVWSGGLPTGGVADLFASDGAKLKFVDVSGLLPALRQLNDVYQAGSIPASTYKTPGDVPTVVMPNLLLVRDDFPTGAACAITKLMFQKKADLEKATPAAAGLDPKVAGDTGVIELNAGSKAALASLGS